MPPRRTRRQSAPTLRRRKNRGQWQLNSEILWPLLSVGFILFLAGVGLLYEFNASSVRPAVSALPSRLKGGVRRAASVFSRGGKPHLEPKVPVLPIFAPVPNAESLIQDVLEHDKPTVAGVVALLQKFMSELHDANMKLSAAPKANAMNIIETFFHLTKKWLGKFDEAYRDKPIFPIREDGSIFLSLAAYREHLLADTMKYAFEQAKHPEKLFIGAVVQNCFGKVREDGTVDPSGLPCKTGIQVVGKKANGKDLTKISDAPPDKNGIEEFCKIPEMQKYCNNGQVRVLYIHETEALGPAMARYYASKLWGGETYFLQMDSHLMFAKEWDEKFRDELQATRNFPKSVLSSYPPGFSDSHNRTVHESNGARLCTCETKVEDPNPIVRINAGRGYRGNETRPTQIPFIAAGFFMARAEFLLDVPFDPYMLWLFMGEEIALSMRAWTKGWDIYAPRKNLIAHQYRPGRLGLPKYWEIVNNLYHGVGNYGLQGKVLKRTKHMVGYPDSTLDKIDAAGIRIVLMDIEHYGLGSERSWDAYMKHACMEVDQVHDAIACKRNTWCNQGLKD